MARLHFQLGASHFIRRQLFPHNRCCFLLVRSTVAIHPHSSCFEFKSTSKSKACVRSHMASATQIVAAVMDVPIKHPQSICVEHPAFLLDCTFFTPGYDSDAGCTTQASVSITRKAATLMAKKLPCQAPMTGLLWQKPASVTSGEWAVASFHLRFTSS